MSLTLTLSRPTGEGTARPVFRSFQSGWIRPPTEHDCASPLRYVFSVGFRESGFQTVVARASRPCVGLHDSHGRDARATTLAIPMTT